MNLRLIDLTKQAYTTSTATQFNGFSSDHAVIYIDSESENRAMKTGIAKYCNIHRQAEMMRIAAPVERGHYQASC